MPTIAIREYQETQINVINSCQNVTHLEGEQELLIWVDHSKKSWPLHKTHTDFHLINKLTEKKKAWEYEAQIFDLLIWRLSPWLSTD